MNFYLDFNDRRLPYVDKMLKRQGFNTYTLNFEDTKNINSGDIIVLSPAFKWKEEYAKALPEGVSVVCGKVSDDALKILNQKNIKHFNLMQNEDFVLKNAVLTAEGMLADLILNTKKTIFDTSILILGGGRVAKAVGVLFHKLGLDFDLSMRDDNKLLEGQLVCKNLVSWKTFKDKLKDYDVVINTIPVKLFEQEDIKKFKPNSIVFELASIKCLQDVNFEEFSYVLCPALPSKYTPESAGKLIFEYLLNVFKGEI